MRFILLLILVMNLHASSIILSSDIDKLQNEFVTNIWAGVNKTVTTLPYNMFMQRIKSNEDKVTISGNRITVYSRHNTMDEKLSDKFRRAVVHVGQYQSETILYLLLFKRNSKYSILKEFEALLIARDNTVDKEGVSNLLRDACEITLDYMEHEYTTDYYRDELLGVAIMTAKINSYYITED
jgi:hypothetical protein